MSGITDPSEAYFKDGVWGWDGSVWRKAPLSWGYSGTYVDTASAENVGAGDAYIDLSVGASGEIRIATHCTLLPLQANATVLDILLRTGGTDYTLLRRVAWTAGQELLVQGPVILGAEDILRAHYSAAGGGDDFYLFAMGYKMKIAE